MSDHDLVVGWKLMATMQRRTPLAWLLRHGEFHEGGDPPTEVVPTRHASWLPIARSWRSLGIEFEELPEPTIASEVGQIPADGGDFLPFLIEYRMIVEEGGGSLLDLASRHPQYRNLLFPPSTRKGGKLQKAGLALSISILNYEPIPGRPDEYHFNFEFHCTECGGYLIRMPDSEDQHVCCTACGVAFGTLASVKERCRSIGIDEMRLRKLGVFREG
ncbi:hypothetical protein [Bradyrhizobium sp. USDA 4353]